MAGPSKTMSIDIDGWDKSFEQIVGLHGAYTSCTDAEGQLVAWNNTRYQGLKGGISRFQGDWNTMKEGNVVIENSIINDLFDSENALHEDRFFTRPVVVFSKRENRYYAIAHVAKGYPPEDARVYPCFLSSEKGNPDTWYYHGMLKGEVWDEFGPSGKTVWGSGMGFVINDEAQAEINHEKPASNRFLFYTDGYGKSLSLLYSSSGEQWFFARDEAGEIRELAPSSLHSQHLIFPAVVKTPRYFHCWVTDGWPPNGIWHLYSEDGLNWTVWGDSEEPKIPRNPRYKNMNVYYDPVEDVIHGLLSVQHKGGVYHKFHSTFSDTEE